jgi:serine/threonine protein phosphatase 1
LWQRLYRQSTFFVINFDYFSLIVGLSHILEGFPVPRHLAIGDIHGCITAFRTLIDLVGPESDDTVITLGDYVDRGPDSNAVLEMVMRLGQRSRHIPLRGNHEIMMLDAREKGSWYGPWLQYGGEETLRSYSPSLDAELSFDHVPQAHIDFLQNDLQSHYESDTHFFVHANAAAGIPISSQPDAARYWQKYKDPAPHCSGKIMVCGHTAQLDGMPRSNGHSICIDTFVYGNGWLSCLDVESGFVYQANEAGETRKFALQERDRVPVSQN